jgi:Leucine-rich repeat (LRR) protein
MNCNLKSLKKKYFNRLPILTHIFLINCNLEVIEHKAFSNLKSLRFLDLSRNRIKFIEKDTFSNLKNLEILDLSSNELKNLDSKFIGVRNLAQFFLENDQMATFNSYWYMTRPIRRDATRII